MKKPHEQIKRVGLIANLTKLSSRVVTHKAATLIRQAGRAIASEENTARIAKLSCETFPDAAALARAVDLLVVFGGDGTMLRVVREIRGARTPVLGINVGRLGFLTAVPSKHLNRALKKIWANEFTIETRPLIEANGFAQGKPIHLRALNDIVISRGATQRMIELGVAVNDEPLTTYRCDGLIVSSPTGSTAYSLSAGGAIVSPDTEVFTLTPICPHTLSNRSFIISLDAAIQVKVLSELVDTSVAADGQVQMELATGDIVTIRRSRHGVRLVRLSGSSFFETVRQKLNWSGSNV